MKKVQIHNRKELFLTEVRTNYWELQNYLGISVFTERRFRHKEEAEDFTTAFLSSWGDYSFITIENLKKA